MQNEILINASRGETRVAILEKGSLAELLVERRGESSMVGSVVKGRVTRVLPGMQASFVDIGLEKAAFLYAGDYYDYNDVDLGDDEGESRPRPQRGRGRQNGRSRVVPKIDTILSEGQEIVVQVAKEPIGTKGARITSHVAIAGRHLVLTPSGSRVGVSRRIDSDRERRRLREIVERLRPRDVGFIIRTAGEGAREADLEADVKYLAAAWEEIKNRRDEHAPAVLYAEPSLPLRVVRDVANPETRRIVVDSPQVFEEMMSFVSRFVADPKPRVELYRGVLPIFDHFGIEPEIDANLGRKVWLKSGGYLIVDQSEALTAIDVNTGRYVGKRDLEETVLKTNLEAVKEVVHQLRFRNIGGLIIVDLIDMETSENREKVYRAFQEALRQDKAKTNILKISELGLVEMTRKRTRENLVQQLCEPCSHCEGRGYVLSRDSVAQKVLREIKKDLPHFCGRRIAISVSARVAEVLLGAEREALAELEAEMGRQVEVRAVPSMHQEQFEVIALDGGPPVEIPLTWLGTGEPIPEPELIRGVVERPPIEEMATPAPLAAAEDPEEKRSPAAAPMAPFAALALEAFSPLDLGSDSEADEPDETVDGAPNFRILPRPEQGEES
jgi:ribonuclease G